MTQTCVVIGAGHAGGRAVEALVKHEYPGKILLVGEEPTLPFERPPLSKQYLKEPDDVRLPLIRPQQWYEDNAIEVVLGQRVSAIDPGAQTITLSDGSSRNYTSILLATGGVVRRLQTAGADLEGIHYIRSRHDADRLHGEIAAGKRVVVVGGGFIGLEAAAVASEMGADVTVVEAAPGLIGRAVVPEIADSVLARFAARGVDVRLDTAVSGFSGDGRVGVVHTAKGDIECDVVIVGIGIIPDTEVAEAAGVTVNNGIEVDEYCRTSVDGIYAAGDVTSHHNPRYDRRMRLESWQNAQNQAIVAARNICGQEVAYEDIPWFWSDQFDFKIQAAGAPLPGDATVLRGEAGADDLIVFQVRDDRVTGIQSIGALKEVRRARKLLEKDKQISVADLANLEIAVKDLVK